MRSIYGHDPLPLASSSTSRALAALALLIGHWGCSSETDGTAKVLPAGAGGGDIALDFGDGDNGIGDIAGASKGDDAGASASGDDFSGSEVVSSDAGAASADTTHVSDSTVAADTGGEPPIGNLCEPCSASVQCQASGDASAACIKRGALGNFCGSSCEQSKDCPKDFACTLVYTTEGPTAKQCVAQDVGGKPGECTCSASAVANKLSTVCHKPALDKDGQVIGNCTGVRTCGDGGLSECIAAPPGAETCDALDNDCDGKTDEETCDDSDVCTSDLCSDGKCVHTPTTGSACDDGDACTSGELCDKGQCSGGTLTCECKVDLDCASKEDGNKCNGTLACDQASYTCQLDAKTIVACTASGKPCQSNTCNANTGKCGELPVSDGLGCDDGDACTANDACQGGSCKPGKMTCQCKTNLDCIDKGGANKCLGSSMCKANKCVPVGQPVLCNTAKNTECLKATCVPQTGKCEPKSLPDGTVCNAADPCALANKCSGGKCIGASVGPCDDKNPCTTDSCDKGAGKCIHDAVKDGTPCQGGTCTKGVCGGGGGGVAVSVKAADIADAFIESASKQGSHKYLILGKSGSYPKKRSLLRFDLAKIPAGKKVVSAKLRVYVQYWHVPSSIGAKEPAIDRIIEVYRVLKKWTEKGVSAFDTGTGAKWSKKLLATDGTDAAKTAAVSRLWPAGSKGWQEFDITALTQSWLDHPAKNHGVLLKANNEDKSGREPRCWSKNAAGKADMYPYLMVEYVK